MGEFESKISSGMQLSVQLRFFSMKMQATLTSMERNFESVLIEDQLKIDYDELEPENEFSSPGDNSHPGQMFK